MTLPSRPTAATERPVVRALIAAAMAMIIAGCSGPAPAPGAASSSPTSSSSPPVVVTPSPTVASSSPSPAVSTSSRTPAPRPTASSTPAPKRPVIVIDPGHSGRSIRSVDADSGLRDIDYPNYPEIYEAFDISACVARGLRLDGYRVVLAKKHALDSVGLAARARLATRLDADLAISVHDDHGQSAAFEATYDQRGLARNGRYPAMYRGSGRTRTVFDRPVVARRSQRYAKIIAAARTTAQGRPVGVRENSFSGRPPLEPGNLALVQLLTEVPWVYNEMGAKTAGSVTRAMSIDSELGYARGLLVGIERSVPVTPEPVRQPSAGTRQLRRCLVEKVEPSPGRFTRPRAYLPYRFGE